MAFLAGWVEHLSGGKHGINVAVLGRRARVFSRPDQAVGKRLPGRSCRPGPIVRPGAAHFDRSAGVNDGVGRVDEDLPVWVAGVTTVTISSMIDMVGSGTSSAPLATNVIRNKSAVVAASRRAMVVSGDPDWESVYSAPHRRRLIRISTYKITAVALSEPRAAAAYCLFARICFY